jgi:hypothetical protein
MAHLVPLPFLGPWEFFYIILFLSTNLLTRMTCISMHVSMASEFLVAWQFLSKRTIVYFLLRIKLHAQFHGAHCRT